MGTRSARGLEVQRHFSLAVAWRLGRLVVARLLELFRKAVH